MLELSVLDWMILFVVLMNVLGAVGQGFFYNCSRSRESSWVT